MPTDHQEKSAGRWVHGTHAVMRRLETDPGSLRELRVIAPRSERLARLLHLAERARIPIRESDENTLRRLTGTSKHQGVAALTQPFAYATFEHLVSGGMEAVLMLDQLQDPHNFGALLRTAVAAGVSGVIIPRHGAVGVTPAVEKVAAGAATDVPICRVANLRNALESLHAAGLWSIGLVPSGGEDLFEAELPRPWVLVVGGEQGLRPLVERTCQIRVSIPMDARVESLNASVAGAIALYELRRRKVA